MTHKYIRNFSIIAHIDHGKSTLSDRLLEKTGLMNDRNKKEQALDSLAIERERGITVKSALVSLNYQAKNKNNYLLNLIDTPGHVDFSYEVSRSLAACEGAILVVDATQGIEAQTIANYYKALEEDLTILPVINKIDLPAAAPQKVSEEITKEFGLNQKDIIPISAKSGIGVDKLLEKIVQHIPSPKITDENSPEKNLKALVFDSFFDAFRGVIVLVRIFSGEITVGDKVKFFYEQEIFEVEELGFLEMQKNKKTTLTFGEVGYVILGIKQLAKVRIGDTLTNGEKPCLAPLQGYQEIKPMVFAGVYPLNAENFNDLKNNLEKLKLNDSSLQFEKENSSALGFGFRCGFLGVLHMEIFQERLSQEFNTLIILTVPSVKYKIYLNSDVGKAIFIDNPDKFPPVTHIFKIEEPFIKASIILPDAYLGNVMKLVQEKRGMQKNLNYLSPKRVELNFEIPLAEIVFDFYHKLKSVTKGYASLDYELIDYRPADIVKVDILVNKEKVDALSFISHKTKARERAQVVLSKLKNEISRHMFAIPLQAAIESNIIARETISALRKDVTAKCYGGDISRKRKLLEKQKEGKKKMRSFGKVEIPNQAFISFLKKN